MSGALPKEEKVPERSEILLSAASKMPEESRSQAG